MPNIDSYLAKIREAVYGEEVRGSIHDALAVMNNNIDASSQENLRKSIISAEWSSSTNYKKDDYVWYPSFTNGILFRAKQDNHGQQPNPNAATAYWESVQITSEQYRNANDIIKVQTTQPTEKINKIWIDDPDSEVSVPTFNEFIQAVAPEYSSTGRYAVGDYCLYEGVLYRCTTAITANEAWTAGHWTPASLGPDLSDLSEFSSSINNEVADLKSAIAFNDGSYPFISIDSWVEGSYVDASDGSFKNYAGWHRSGYIEIGSTDGGIIHFDNTKGSNSLYNVFYDENHTKVGSNFNTNNADIAIPANAVYFAVSIEEAYSVSANKPIVTLINRATKESVNNFIQKYGKNELFSSIVKRSYVDRSDGSFVPYAGWDRTDYIDISFFDAILVETDTSTLYNAFYSSEKTFIKSFGITPGVNKIAIPEGAGYVVFSCEDDYIESIKVHKSYISESGGGSSGENGRSFMQDECLLLRNNLPSYYISYPQTASTYTAGAYIDLKADEVSLADKNFIFITDVHWPSNAKQSNKLIAYLRKKLHIDNVIHGGDILDYDQDSPHLASVHMREWVDEARAAAGSGLLPVHGNHDINTGSGRSDEQTEQDIMPYAIAESIQLDGSKPFIVQETDEQIAARIASITFDSTADRNDVIAYYKLHYYYDDSKNKMRYIILNHGTHLNGIIHKYFNVRQFGEVFLQMDWLYETLMSTPDDYTVVVAMHAFINWGTNKVESGPFQVCNLLSGYKQKDPNRRITNSNQISGNVYPYGYHYYNFSNAKKPKGIICLGGDMHWDYAYVVRTAEGAESGAYTDSLAQHPDSIVVVHTQTDAYGRTYPPGTYLSDTWPMEQGTVTEQCFDIVSIEQYNENYVKAKFTRIGAGENREFLLNLQQQ